MFSRVFGLAGVLFLLLMFLSPVSSDGRVITVRQDGSGDFAKIGDGVAAAEAGDVIRVGPGVYAETVYVPKSLDFVSEEGPSLTLLDGGVLGEPVLRFEGGGAIVAAVEGFTFQNGNYWNNGGAVRVSGGAAVTIKACMFKGNRSGYTGGAIFVRDYPSTLSVYDCVFSGNYAVWAGGAVGAVLGADAHIIGCEITLNTCDGQSAGLQCNDGTMEVRNCLFRHNSSADLTGGVYLYRSRGVVENNTFFENTAPGVNGASLVVHQCVPETIVSRNIFSWELAGWGLNVLQCTVKRSCNLYSNNARGSIRYGAPNPDEVEADPMFCSPASGNFSVDYASPAAPLHSPCGALIGAFEAGCGTLPVFVTRFDAFPENRGVALAWELVADEGILGFHIYRRNTAVDQDVILNSGLPVPANERTYTDQEVAPGETYEYTLGVVLSDGSEVYSQRVTVTTPAALFALGQNVPNPFNPSTRIPYSVREPGQVRLQVFDPQGVLIRTLVSEFKSAGAYTAEWDGTNGKGNTVATGVYFARIETGGQVATRKMLMVK